MPERSIERVIGYRARTEEAWSSITRSRHVRCVASTTELSELAHRIARRTHAAVERSDERLSMRVDRLVRCGPGRAGDRDTTARRGWRSRSAERSIRVLQRSHDRLDVLEARVASLDPAVQLARTAGRSHAEPDGNIIRSIDDIGIDDIVTTAIIDGSITSAVRQTTPIEGPIT